MNADQYGQQLDALLPQGAAWPRDADAKMRLLTRGLAEEFARVDMRANDLLSEVLPNTTVQMLDDWERAAGLPDTCVATGQTLQERRSALLARLTNMGGQSRAFFIELAKYLGFTITITEFRQFRAGISRAGEPLCGDPWLHTWRVNAPQTTIVAFRSGVSGAGEPLRKWGNELLECVFGRVKPAHTVLLFGYGVAEYVEAEYLGEGYVYSGGG